MVGLEGFEPSHDGVKVRCLTAWRQPITYGGANRDRTDDLYSASVALSQTEL